MGSEWTAPSIEVINAEILKIEAERKERGAKASRRERQYREGINDKVREGRRKSQFPPNYI